MPAIDLARLRKQANRLADFFFLPDEFMKHLREVLDFYVNYTLRTKENIAPGSNLKTYRTPPVVLRQIENELRTVAEANPHFALGLADVLWDEGALETRLLAAFLIGRIPPQEERLLARLTAWTQQIRDPEVRAALLSTSLYRMRKETPDKFLVLIQEYLHPARTRTWSNGIQALLPMIADSTVANFPPILDIVEPILMAAPATLQIDLEELIISLYRASPTETAFLLKQVVAESGNPMTRIALRRISSSFPVALQNELRDVLRADSDLRVSSPKVDEEIDDFVSEMETLIKEPGKTARRKTTKAKLPEEKPKVRKKAAKRTKALDTEITARPGKVD
jgi:hypothetical protein